MEDDGNLADWVRIDELCLAVHFVKENVIIGPDSRSSDQFLHGIKVLMARNYSQGPSEETRKGMTEKARSGRRVVFGSPARIRTSIHGVKGRCPTIRRPGNCRRANCFQSNPLPPACSICAGYSSTGYSSTCYSITCYSSTSLKIIPVSVAIHK